MILRPILNNKDSFLYGIDFKYPRRKLINVTCEVERPDMKLVVMDPGVVITGSIGYKVTGNPLGLTNTNTSTNVLPRH